MTSQKVRKIPMRKCLGCMQSKPKKELIRIVKNAKTGQIQIDVTGKVSGRGAYFCPNVECLEKALNKAKLGKALNSDVSDEDIKKLREDFLKSVRL